ncbi:MAG TPA: ABC transporter permease [Steroidobacteraceae bacterium]|nr:ABC transporter permease [Steroidobacteraceae bacterium]
MIGYYLRLAARSLRRNVVLTALMIAAVGVGIGASMTVYTVMRGMSGDPIPQKSAQLFTPQIDIWGPQSRQGGRDNLPGQLTYRDATALMRAQHATRQAAMYAVSQDVTPVGARSFRSQGRATHRDFFAMFDVPFRSGGPWGRAEEDKRANVVVLSSKLADRVFPHMDAVGKVINLSDRDYRVVGIIKPWQPMPRFYDLFSGDFGEAEQFFIPFPTAIDRHLNTSGNENCQGAPSGGWDAHLNSDCVWISLWAELPTAAQARDYASFLRNYAAEQRQLGRFHWPPRVELRNVEEWLSYMNVVPPAVRAISFVADGFLVVCLINAVGLLLAKFSSRARELALRRALGASRGAIFQQCVAETLLIGLVGGVLGLMLTAAGAAGMRALLAEASRWGVDVQRLISLDAGMAVTTLVVGVVVTVSAGLYPTWRASRVHPAWQLKAQ